MKLAGDNLKNVPFIRKNRKFGFVISVIVEAFLIVAYGRTDEVLNSLTAYF